MSSRSTWTGRNVVLEQLDKSKCRPGAAGQVKMSSRTAGQVEMSAGGEAGDGAPRKMYSSPGAGQGKGGVPGGKVVMFDGSDPSLYAEWELYAKVQLRKAARKE